METSYKALIAVACVAGIATTGLLFWNYHQAGIEREQVAEYAEYLACRNMLESIRTASLTATPPEQELKACMFSGHYSPTELSRAVADMKAKSSF